MTLRGFEEKQGTEKGNERRWWSGGKQEEEEGRLGRKARGRERKREVEGVEREQGKIRRVVLLSGEWKRLGAGGLEQVITSGCGADAARAGPS